MLGNHASDGATTASRSRLARSLAPACGAPATGRRRRRPTRRRRSWHAHRIRVDDSVPTKVSGHLRKRFGHNEGVQYWFRTADTQTRTSSAGFASRRPPRRVTPATTFHCFSTTKPITALALLQLAADAKVDLDAPVRESLPEIPYDNGMTARQLLSHQAGLPNPMPLAWVHRAEDHASFDRQAFLDRVLKENARAEPPGKKARYSNIGYLLLGALIERASGQPYPVFVRQRILDVVRSRDVTAFLDFEAPVERHAVGYTRVVSGIGLALGLMRDRAKLRTREGGWIRYHPFHLDGAAYGGLEGNVRGWAPLLTAIVTRDPRLLPPEWYATWFAPQSLASGAPSGHALSWFTGETQGHKHLRHAGGGSGYGAEIRIYPELGAASAILCNTTVVSDTRMLDDLDALWLP